MSVRAAAGAGALWGLAGYAILWGHIPIEVHRPFVESFVGTLLLLPVRLVLWCIHGLERLAGRSFDLSADSGWIGLAITAVGAGVAAVVALGVRSMVRGIRARRSGGKGVPEPAQRV